MLIDFFLERSRIELMNDGLRYRGRVLDLPEIDVTGSTPEECRTKLAAAVGNLLAREARHYSQSDSAAPQNAKELKPGDEAVAPIQSADTNGAVREDQTTPAREPDFTDIIYAKKNLIARLTINRPAAYNAYTDHTLREMTAAFRDAAADNNVAVLVLTGAGDRAFCAGSDVQQHGDKHVGDARASREWMDVLIEAHTALRRLAKPSIARINGMAAGGGNEWNLACDLAIAADHAKFVQIETKVGLAAAAGAAHRLPLLVGERRARELFLTGEPISANKALLWGLVNDVVPYKKLDKAVDALCRKLIDRFPRSTSLVRAQLSFWKDLEWASMTGESRDDLAAQFAGEEAAEGLRALAEKREVDYRGFRRGAHIVHQRDQSEKEDVTGVNDRTMSIGTRSCYSCGAQDISASFDFCGLCGTRLV